MKFAWAGRDAAGRQSGELEAASAGAAAEQLRQRGITPLRIEAQSGAAADAEGAGEGWMAGLQAWARGGITTVDMLIFARQLHTLLKSGVPILRTLEIVSSASGKCQIEDACSEIAKHVSQGGQVSEVKQKVFGLLIDSLLALRRENKETIYSSMVKDTMKRKKPSFNEGYYGYRTFSELLEDAQREGLVELDDKNRVVLGDRQIALSPREYALLAFLLRRRGEVVPRLDILREVFGCTNDPGTNAIDVHLAHLRRKLAGTVLSFETVRGAGICVKVESS